MLWVIPIGLKCYRFYCPSRSTKIVEAINAMFFGSGDCCESSMVRGRVFEEEHQAVSV